MMKIKAKYTERRNEGTNNTLTLRKLENFFLLICMMKTKTKYIERTNE